MELITCIFILLAKVLETSLATFRIIVINNGKKIMGAVLSGIISIVWMISTSMVVLDLTKHPMRILFLALGCFLGSYLGSYIEEKMAMGSTMLMVVTNNALGAVICDDLRSYGYAVTYTKATGKDSIKNILLIMVPRKQKAEVTEIIKKTDDKAMIISQNAKAVWGGYYV